MVNDVYFFISDELLCNCCLLLDKLLDLNDILCSNWASSELILALIEAVKQCGYKTNEPIDTILHLLQLLSTTPVGVEALGNRISLSRRVVIITQP